MHTVKAVSGKPNMDTSSDKFTGMDKTMFPAYSERVDAFGWLRNLGQEIIIRPIVLFSLLLLLLSLLLFVVVVVIIIGAFLSGRIVTPDRSGTSPIG